MNMIANSPLPMAATEGEQHTVLFANAAFCALQGRSAGEIVGHPIAKAVSGTRAHDVIGYFDRVYEGRASVPINNLQYSDFDRTLSHKSYTAWPLPSEDGGLNGLVVQIGESLPSSNEYGESFTSGGFHELNREIQEINERLVVNAIRQQTLAEIAAATELRLRNLIQGLNAIVCEIDASTGIFTFVSDRAEAFLGYSLNQWNEVGFWKTIIHEDDYDNAMAALARDDQVGESLQHTFRVKASNGSEIWLRNILKVDRNPDGSIAKRRCVMVDATEQQSITTALAAELKRNRAIAEAMQYSILWKQPEKIFAGLKVATFYEPAAGDMLVGGDFFDAFRLGDDSVMLVVGDVTGKGLKAAARTVEVTFALRAFAQDYHDPAETLDRLNKFICDFHHDDDHDIGNALVVLSLVVVNTVTGVTQVASAGAERPFIVRSEGTVDIVAARGLILGIDRTAVYGTADVTVNVGDTLIMTTDGITESRRNGVFFGDERMYETALEAGTTGSPQEIGRTIVNTARAFAGGQIGDDVCMLLVRRIEAPIPDRPASQT